MSEILQNQFPDDLRRAATRGLPGMQPLEGADWICVDDAYGAQLAFKERLLEARRDAVLAVRPAGAEATVECLDAVLALLDSRDDFTVRGGVVTRPDGGEVQVARDDPMGSLARLVQEDICILRKTGAGYVLEAALLCFPASWMLREKMGRPMGAIHGPVAEYGDQMNVRVERLFDNVRLSQPMWRANYLRYAEADLFQPRSETERRDKGAPARFERSERQTIWRLPRSEAVVFSIHTTVVRL